MQNTPSRCGAYLQLRSYQCFEWELRRNWATVKGPQSGRSLCCPTCPKTKMEMFVLAEIPSSPSWLDAELIFGGAIDVVGAGEVEKTAC